MTNKNSQGKIDVTTTATLRPEILKRTLESFRKNMLTDVDRYRLIINIDPIGQKGCTCKKMVNVARRYFNDVIYNFPDKPCFAKAVIWCWRQTKTEYVFHLEDDWILSKLINIDSMIKILKRHSEIASMRLSKNKVIPSESTKKYGFKPERKISLNPNLIKRDFITKVLPLMIETKNPEKQLRPNNTTRMGRLINTWRFGVYTNEGLSPLVYDIGRPWMGNSPFKKRTGFTQWEKKEKKT